MKTFFASVLLVLLWTSAARAQTVVTTLAGRGGAGGCPAFAIPPIGGSTFFVDPVYGPVGVAVDGAGKLFVSMASNCIFRLDADGLLRLGFLDSGQFRIGTGTPGFSDNAPSFDAAFALISNPQHLALDRSGNLYFADSSNHVIRRVDTKAWTISTVAGGGSLRPIDGTPATSVSFLFPTSVAVDPSGNLFIVDSNAEKVFKVDTNGILTVFAGYGGSTYNGEGIPAVSAGMIPMDVEVDAAGDVFIADWSNSIVRKVTPDGLINTVAGNPFNVTGLGDGGPAAFGGILAKPRGIALDGLGNLYIADTEHHRIRMVDTSGIITTVAGDGTSGSSSTQLNYPYDVAADTLGNIFIADTANNELRGVIVSQRTYALTLTSAGSGTGTVSGGGAYTVGNLIPVSAVPAAGSTFAGWSGPNAAECASGLVLMDADKSCTATFTTVADTTPPVLSNVPGSFSVTTTNPAGAIVTYPSPTATDPDDTAGPVTCTPGSGFLFPVGTTTVTCTSTDTHGNTGSASFSVTVLFAAVTISVSETITVTDTGDTTIILVSAAEPIAVADNVTVTVAVPVLVEENISVGDSSPVDILDTTPPVLALPSTITVDATSPVGATVTYSATANDLVSGPVPVTCTPVSGATFAIGTTSVACSARDAAGNAATGSFAVVVLSPAQMLSNLMAATSAAGFQQAVNLLQNAASSVARGNTLAACGQAGAFMNQVSAQAGKTLTTGVANQLLAVAADIKATLGCP